MRHKHIKGMIDELIVKQIEYMDTLEDGSIEKMRASDELAKLHELRNKEKISVKDGFKLCLEGLGIAVSVGTLGVTVWATKKGFKFEETGTFVSQTFKQFLSTVLKPRK